MNYEMNAPLLSIVIVNYNYGRFLEEAIRSVVTQAGFDRCELILVDGGSGDNSVDIIKKHDDKIAWWVSEKDKGQSDAFNKGFSHARGRFGCWLNADDILMPGALMKVLNYLTENPKTEWLAGSSVYADVDLRIWKCSRCVKVWRWLGKLQPASPVNGPSSFFLVENLRRLGGFDLNAHYQMDIDLWRRFQREGIRLHQLKDYIWCFRCHEASKTAGELTAHAYGDRQLQEAQTINMRYGITRGMRKISEWINRFCRLITGTYIWSFIDARRYSGKLAWEVK